MVWAKHHCLSPPKGIIGNHFFRSEPDKILGGERILAMDQLIQEKYYCSNTPSCRKRMENKCCSYASRYLNPDYARICFADPDGPTSHASSISGRCRRQSSSTALSASGARSRKQCPRPTQACPSTPSHTKGRSSSPTGRDRSC